MRSAFRARQWTSKFDTGLRKHCVCSFGRVKKTSTPPGKSSFLKICTKVGPQPRGGFQDKRFLRTSTTRGPTPPLPDCPKSKVVRKLLKISFQGGERGRCLHKFDVCFSPCKVGAHTHTHTRTCTQTAAAATPAKYVRICELLCAERKIKPIWTKTSHCTYG